MYGNSTSVPSLMAPMKTMMMNPHTTKRAGKEVKLLKMVMIRPPAKILDQETHE